MDFSLAIRHATHRLTMGVPLVPCLGRRAHRQWNRLDRPWRRQAVLRRNDSKMYGWTMAFLAAAANFAFAYWELSIVRSTAASDAINVRGSSSQKPRSS
jgi:hypothetical protein